MIEANTKAAFNLDGYRVKQFSLHEPPANQNDLSLTFDPTGKFYSKEKKYVLQFEFTAMYGEEDKPIEFLRIVVESDFIFSDDVSVTGIPDYFYPNSIAIVFPYVRAFVSALSTLANMKPLILPVLNLGALKEVLLQNTEML